MRSGGVGGQKLSPPLNYIFGKNGILEENFDFFLPKNNIFFQKIFGTSQDIHKSAVQFSTFI
jgi:hypothetical protein